MCGSGHDTRVIGPTFAVVDKSPCWLFDEKSETMAIFLVHIL